MGNRNQLRYARTLLRAKKWKKRWVRGVSLLAAMVVFVTTYALILPAITLESGPSCGLEEHKHTDACYEERPVLICGLEEGEDHTHGEACYSLEKTLICGLPEHTHTDACYTDLPPGIKTDPPLAETSYDWEASLKDLELTGDLASDLLAVAESQLGYKGTVLTDKETQSSTKYSRYGDWYGERNHDWNSLFVLFSLHYASEEGR